MTGAEFRDDWGCPFYGTPETISGNLYWYTDDDGMRHPLIPVFVGLTPHHQNTENTR